MFVSNLIMGVMPEKRKYQLIIILMLNFTIKEGFIGNWDKLWVRNNLRDIIKKFVSLKDLKKQPK